MRLCKLMYCGEKGDPFSLLWMSLSQRTAWLGQLVGVYFFSTDIPLPDFPFSSSMPQVTFVWCLTCVRRSAPSQDSQPSIGSLPLPLVRGTLPPHSDQSQPRTRKRACYHFVSRTSSHLQCSPCAAPPSPPYCLSPRTEKSSCRVAMTLSKISTSNPVNGQNSVHW